MSGSTWQWAKCYPKQDFFLWLKFQDGPQMPQLSVSAENLGIVWICPVFTWQLCIKCRGALDQSWEHNKSCKGTKTVIMLPQEVSVCGECFSGFQHQQNPPHWCGSALPHHCYLSSKIKVTITPHFPWGSSNKLMNCFASNNSVKIKQQTNKPKRRKEDELIRSDARIEQLISWLQIQSTKHPICWIICPRLRHHAWHCPSSLQEASHGCVFLWFSTPVWLKTLALRNWHFVEWKEHSTKFVLGET